MATAQLYKEPQTTPQAGISRWWRVVGGLSMNLALGTLYAWSVFVAPLEKQFGWKRADTSMVFTIAAAMVALGFVVAGRIQDRGIATPSGAQLARGLSAEGMGAWRRYADQLSPVLPLLQPWVERYGYAEA